MLIWRLVAGLEDRMVKVQITLVASPRNQFLASQFNNLAGFFARTFPRGDDAKEINAAELRVITGAT